MNQVLKLKGEFRKTQPEEFHIGPPQLPANTTVSTSDLEKLASQLERIDERWTKADGFINEKPVVSVYYSRIVPKSRRMKRLLSEPKKTSDDTIVGARFWYKAGLPRHQIVHCLSRSALRATIGELNTASAAVEKLFPGGVDSAALSNMNKEEHKTSYDERLKDFGVSRSALTQIIADVADVERFDIDMHPTDVEGDAIVTLYSTDLSVPDLFSAIGLDYADIDSIDANTVVLRGEQLTALKEKAPYLMAMSLNEYAETPPDDENARTRGFHRNIDPPKNEPIIGVIDTLFDKDKERVYFSDWVDFKDMVSPDYPRDETSYLHGTKVASIIVDGPSLNPLMEDGCGHFRVRHFGVAAGERFSMFYLAKVLRGIVSNNTDIKVWNLSLGSVLPVSPFSISPIASIIDQLECEFDVVFVIAGTNDNEAATGNRKRIGSPADSINSLVVNAVRSDGSPASYSRRGPVLGFYEKPDVCYFGGDDGDYCLTWANGSEYYSKGTSFAAPWIARKLAFLIHIVGLPRESAKALIIDSALGWGKHDSNHAMGYGVVPTHIRTILMSESDEIRFIISGTAGPYETFNYGIPIPISKGAQPYYARVTLCYFPSCTRAQGVDYTNTELDLKFGRLSNGRIKPINNDMQGDPCDYTTEDEARKYYRKWDNVKVIGEIVKTRRIPKKTYASPYWGISMVAKKRLAGGDREELRFGLVVTLKEMNGVNRIDNFIKNCESSNWTVEAIDIDTSVEIYKIGEEDIEFE